MCPKRIKHHLFNNQKMKYIFIERKTCEKIAFVSCHFSLILFFGKEKKKPRIYRIEWEELDG